jgi:hypothetical protein
VRAVLELEIEMLAASEAELRDRLYALEVDRHAYRELLQLAVHALHNALAENARQFDTIVLQRESIRELRRDRRTDGVAA